MSKSEMTIDDVLHNLDQLAKQIICPSDNLWARMAAAIRKDHELLNCVKQIGGAVGCGHTEDAHGRSKLVQCVQDRMAIVDMIEKLCVDEGRSITILCPNPDGEPNRTVVCNGDWTGYEDVRFSGLTLSNCLESASAAFREAQA